MKCDICKNELAVTFLGKIKGTYFKDKKGKKYLACFECQKKLSKDEMLEKV